MSFVLCPLRFKITSICLDVYLPSARTRVWSRVHKHSLSAMAKNLSTAKISAYGLVFDRCGRPEDVLRIEKIALSDLKPTSVLLKVLASPVNPSDTAQVLGIYAKAADFSNGFAIPGLSGAMQVLDTGAEVQGLSKGDWVIQSQVVPGMWVSHRVLDQSQVKKIHSRNLDVACAISVNPMTAYYLMKNFVSLKPGDVIIQSGANSGCGQIIVQLARNMGVKTINVVRDRPNYDEIVQKLKKLGATVVIKPEEVRGYDVKKELNTDSLPILAIDIVAGDLGTDMIKKLSPYGHYVCYGGMAFKPVPVPVGCLIFKTITVHGFWLTDPNIKRDPCDMDNVFKLFEEGKLVSSTCRYINIDQAEMTSEDLHRLMRDFASYKYDEKPILTFNSSVQPKL